MREWYRRLLAVRREYVLTTERRCDVRVAGYVLTMAVGSLLLQAGLKAGKALTPAMGKTLLESDEDGFAVRISSTAPA